MADAVELHPAAGALARVPAGALARVPAGALARVPAGGGSAATARDRLVGPVPLLRRRRLLALCIVGACLEAAVLPGVGLSAARELSPQLTALAPIAVFHDLRWLFVYHDSWLTFALGLVALVAVRSLVTATTVRWAWPADLAPPNFRRAVASSAVFTVLAITLLSPMVTLMFGVGVVPFSWPYLAAVPTALLVASCLSHGSVVGHWWRSVPPLRSLGWLVLDFLVLTVASTAMSWLPVWLAVLPAALAGLFNAWAWLGVTAALARRPRPRWPLPVAPVTALVVLAAVIGGAKLTFVLHAQAQRGSPPAQLTGHGAPVLVVGGFGSACCNKANQLRGPDDTLLVQQFSYAGMSSDGQPLPQGRAATDAPLDELAGLMAAQVQRLHLLTGQPVAIVAESEGSLVALDYLAHYPNAPVDALALLSPIVDPARVSYPFPGRQGWGVAAGYALRGIAGMIQNISPFAVSADGPLLRSIAEHGDLLALNGPCRADLREVVFLPLADALTLPSYGARRVPVVVVDAFHGGLLARPDVEAQVRRWLHGQPITGSDGLTVASRLLSGAGEAWWVPPLVTGTPVGTGCPAT